MSARLLRRTSSRGHTCAVLNHACIRACQALFYKKITNYARGHFFKKRKTYGICLLAILSASTLYAAEVSPRSDNQVTPRRDLPVRLDWCREYTYMRYWPALYDRLEKPRFRLRIVGNYTDRQEQALLMAIGAWNSVFSGHTLVGLEDHAESTIEFNTGTEEDAWGGLAILDLRGNLYEMGPVKLKIHNRANKGPFHHLLSVIIHEIGHVTLKNATPSLPLRPPA